MKGKLFDIVNIAFMIMISISFLLPFLILISQSLRSNKDIMLHGYSLFPQRIFFDAYKYLLVDNVYIYRGLAVSVFVTVVGTFLCLLFTCGFAYGLSKKYLPYRNYFTIFVLITMFFNGGLLPSYILISALGLKDSLAALFLPALIAPFYLFLMRNFFMEIPKELEESAFIDGASHVGIFFRIMIPMSLPAVATIGLFYAVSFWNSWFPAAIYITDQNKWPLQLILKEMIVSLDIKSLAGNGADIALMINLPQESVKAAAVMIVSIPIICVYPFIQKYFVKGIMVGSLKG